MVKRELKGLLRNPVMMLVVAVILLIPSIYTIPFLSSMWDPYGRLSELPVAVVNEDQPVMYQNEMLSVGADLVDNLKENDELDFHFVDKKTAEEGLQDTTYYMTITIPKEFSANASTVMDEEPKRMELKYKTNPGTNYIASKLCTTAMEKIRTSVSEEVSRTYTEAVFDGFDDITSGMDDAADGADQMLSGEKELISGNSKITDGLGTLSAGGTALYNGAKELKDGVSVYTSGVRSVDSGVDQLGEGVIRFKQQVGAGFSQLQTGSSSLKSGLSAYTSGVAAANSGAAQLNANSENLNEGMAALSAGTASLAQGSEALSGGLRQMQKNVASSAEKAQEESIPALKASMSEFGDSLKTLNQMIQSYEAANTGDTQSGKVQSEVSAAKESLEQLRRSDLTEEQQTAVAAIEERLDTISEKASSQTGGADSGASMNAIKQLSAGLNAKYPEMTKGINDGVASLAAGYDTINQSLSAQLIPGAVKIDTGLEQLRESVDNTLLPGVKQYTSGVAGISTGLAQLDKNSSALNKGAGSLDAGVGTLAKGAGSGTKSLSDGIRQLSEGTGELTANSGKLNSGTASLADGASQISSGAGQLADGSGVLGSGLVTLREGTSELKDGLADGAADVKDNKADQDSIEMMTDPVELDGTEEHSVPDNGHAMAAYMMSVALWVGALAFCLMYPLTKYRGELKSGFNWWLSKAVVLYPLAMGMALAMLGLLHKFCGFTPADWKNTILLACVASLAFMSLMYFFNALLGRVGSFIMLVFMIVQLAGSAGTYPIELSGDFVADINPFLPFSYTVVGFRSTISGCEANLIPCYCMLLLILIVFTTLSVWLFCARARKIRKGRHTFHDFIDSRGLA